MKFLTDRQLDTIRGMAMVGAASVADILSVLGHIDALEEALDDLDANDTFGIEGWRHSILGEED